MVKHTMVFVACLSLVLQGCSTMNEKECVVADWQAIGYEDGSRGYSESRFGKYRKACAEYGIKANFASYQTGHTRGLRRYCTPERAYNLGKSNAQFPNICPTDLIGDMRYGYDLGKNLYRQKSALYERMDELKHKIQVIDDDISLLSEELAEHEEYLQIAEEGLENPQTTDLERLVFYTQRREVQKLIHEKYDEIDLLERDKEPYFNSIENLEREIQELDARPMPRLRK